MTPLGQKLELLIQVFDQPIIVKQKTMELTTPLSSIIGFKKKIKITDFRHLMNHREGGTTDPIFFHYAIVLH